MTDSSVPPAAPGAPAASGKSPLDLLEDILKESKGSSPEDAAAAKAQAEQAQAAQQEAEIAQLEAQHQAQDQQDLQAGIAELSTIKETPAYQARIQQETAQSQADAQHASDQQGFEIKQIGHSKI